MRKMRTSRLAAALPILFATLCLTIGDVNAQAYAPASASVTPKGRDLLLDFGGARGVWGYNSAKNIWSYIHSMPIKSAVRADINGNGIADTVVDFGAGGIWALLDNGTWKSIHGGTAKWIIAVDIDRSGRDDLIIDFGTGYGIWAYRNGSTWVQLHAGTSQNAIAADLDHNGTTDVVVDFGPPYGIWTYRFANSSWNYVHGGSSKWMARADLDRNGQDDLIVDFGTDYGIWSFSNNSKWTQLHSGSAKSGAAADLNGSGYRDSLFIDFGAPFGLFRYSAATGWNQIHSATAKGILSVDTDANRKDDLIVDFGADYGVWRWANNSTWTPIHGFTTNNIAAITLPAKLASEFPATTADATRFLSSSTFGPTDTDTTRVTQLGYRAWIEAEFAKARVSHRAYWDTENAAIKASSGGKRTAFGDQVTNSFWKQAIGGDDQLRQRVAFALSQIFVISMADGSIDYWDDRTRGVAGYLDMLGENAFGSYRQLLEAVALHPMMGRYLSHLGNEKEDPDSGRLPDENFAREVMQLFSIGLVQLNLDGTPKLDGLGQPIPTYGPADIAGLAKVFTGWGWGGPDKKVDRWYGWIADANRYWIPMQSYPDYHSVSEKSFLGVTIPAQTTPDPAASLRTALDTLFTHPNVGPFIGKQLIQRLVTSNPSPAYVERVASAFNNNGAGVRGDMKAVIRAVLMDPEARVANTSANYGKVREPILRMSALLRAFGAKSRTGKYLVGRTEDPSYMLAQSPMFSPSVFNFYRPGYIPPNSASGAAGLAVPELQIANEVSIAGYANYVMYALSNGMPIWGDSQGDIKPDYTSLTALAATPNDLVQKINTKMLNGQMSDSLKAMIVSGVASINLPTPTSTNAAQVAAAKLDRAKFALWLAMTSSEFIVQK